MTYRSFICEMKPYIQPFERRLAIQELHSIADAEPIAVSQSEGSDQTLFRVRTQSDVRRLADRLAFWESIVEENAMGTALYTRQLRYEVVSDVARNGVSPNELFDVLPLDDKIAPGKRRNLRYGAHGIHEYRGKFFPQLVRSLINLETTRSDAVVVDTMCGSGTTLVEANVLNLQAYGMDMNPLSVLMSTAKTQILHEQPESVLHEYLQLEADLLSAKPIDPRKTDRLPWFYTLPEKDRRYLERWFDHSVLRKLDPIVLRVMEIGSPPIRDLFVIALSNILRRLSWQKVDDLRVRRQVATEVTEDVTEAYLSELESTVKSVVAFLIENDGLACGQSTVIEGDARIASTTLGHIAGQVDLIITSPPYATALPYLDTDRLSLSYLGLLSRPQHRTREYMMIGNREITERDRQEYLSRYLRQKSSLPPQIVEVIDLIHNLNENSDVGFRRRNLSALLAKYFLDMRETMSQFRTLLKRDGGVYVVVGNNHTFAGGKRIDIPTDDLLGQLGMSIGLKLEDTLPMEMLVSRDIFKKNTGSAETILCFRQSIR